MKTFIIQGGNFQNTGAGSMTMIMVDELRKRYPDCRIVMFAPMKDVNNSAAYKFEIVHMSSSVLRRARFRKSGLKYYFEGVARLLLGKGNQFREYKLMKEILEQCNGVFDISGYAISSQFQNRNTLGKLSNVELFTGYGIPFYFMPQSFGPFDYQENRDFIVKRIREVLPKAKKIFVREEEGYKYLKDLIGGDNLVKSYDMVLQSKGIDKANVYKEQPKINEIRIDTEHNVAVIPNMRNFDHGNTEEILKTYSDVIGQLLEWGRNVYLISHSAEDIEACTAIKDRFAGDDRVVLIKDKIDTWNYELLIRKFDYAIASRFHSIVHSYRLAVPCISLGWATKYKELLETFGQEQYIFDVRDLAGRDKLFDALKKMDQDYMTEKEKIRNRLAEIQNNNCFDLLDV